MKDEIQVDFIKGRIDDAFQELRQLRKKYLELSTKLYEAVEVIQFYKSMDDGGEKARNFLETIK